MSTDALPSVAAIETERASSTPASGVTDRAPGASLLEMGEHQIARATQVEDQVVAFQVSVLSLVPIGRSGKVVAQRILKSGGGTGNRSEDRR